MRVMVKLRSFIVNITHFSQTTEDYKIAARYQISILVASNRPPFVLIRPYIRIRATLLRIAASAKLSHVILRLVNQPPRPALTRCRRLITLRFRCLSPRYSWSLVLGYTGDVLTFEFLDPFAIKLTLPAVRCLQFPCFVSSSRSPSSLNFIFSVSVLRNLLV